MVRSRQGGFGGFTSKGVSTCQDKLEGGPFKHNWEGVTLVFFFPHFFLL